MYNLLNIKIYTNNIDHRYYGIRYEQIIINLYLPISDSSIYKPIVILLSQCTPTYALYFSNIMYKI